MIIRLLVTNEITIMIVGLAELAAVITLVLLRNSLFIIVSDNENNYYLTIENGKH